MKAAANHVLDSFAVLAFIEGEVGAGEVQQLFAAAQQGKGHLWMSVVNFGEVLYIIEREQGLEAAQRAVALVDDLPVTVMDVDRSLALAAAHIKAQHALSYADAFAISLAQSVEGNVVTGDPEYKQVESLVPIHWLRQRDS